MGSGTRRAGDFCWVNILTPRPREARDFFGRVLGWTDFEMPGIGHGIRAGGRDVGGLFDLEGPGTPPGLSPTLGVMVKVEGVDALGRRVEALGGRAKAPFDVGGQGRMAVCFDPDGAEFDLWEPGKMAGTEVDPAEPGAPAWFEVGTTDPARSSAFYTSLFGWTIEGGTTFLHAGVPVAGLAPVAAGTSPRWATHFTVRSVDEAASLAIGLGGEALGTPREIPGIGRCQGLRSPQGVEFHVLEPPT